MLSLRYAAPAPDLRTFISSYYLFRADLPYVVDTTRADLPQLRFMISGAGSYRFGGGPLLASPEVVLTGSTTYATQFEATGPLWVFGAGLLPAGWGLLIGSDASELTDEVEDGCAVFGSIVHDCLDALRDTLSFDRMVAIMNSMFRALIDRQRHNPPYWFTRATDDWLMGEASPRIDALVQHTGVSARQLERLANRIYGAPPKLLARKYRALRIASQLPLHGGEWQDLGADSFYDQSHFIREFKRFTGLTPRQFKINPTPVTKLTLTRRQLGNVLPPLALES